MNIVLGIRSKHRRQLAEKSIQFFINELKLNRSRFNLTVISQKDLHKDEDAFGFVFHLDDREIAMILDSRMNYKNLVETIAHEMIHVKQIAKGTLKHYIKRGKIYRTWCGKKVKDVEYHRRPWELEAFRKEKELTYNFVHHISR